MQASDMIRYALSPYTAPNFHFLSAEWTDSRWVPGPDPGKRLPYQYRTQGKPVDAGTAGTAQERALTLAAKSRADVPDMLASPLPKSNALLHRGRQGTGEFRSVVVQGIIACGHSHSEVRLQVSQVAQLTDDAPTDVLDHGGDVRVGRGLTFPPRSAPGAGHTPPDGIE